MDFPVDISDAVTLGETSTGARPPGGRSASISEAPTLADTVSQNRTPTTRSASFDDALILAEVVHGPFSADLPEVLNFGDSFSGAKPPEKNPDVNFLPRKRRKFFP